MIYDPLYIQRPRWQLVYDNNVSRLGRDYLFFLPLALSALAGLISLVDFFFCSSMYSDHEGPATLGRNRPTRAWYSLYSGYLPAEIHSVMGVLPWNTARYSAAPTKVQFSMLLDWKHDHSYSATQMACSAAKLGWRLYCHRPTVLKPRSSSCAEKSMGAFAVRRYSFFA